MTRRLSPNPNEKRDDDEMAQIREGICMSHNTYTRVHENMTERLLLLKRMAAVSCITRGQQEAAICKSRRERAAAALGYQSPDTLQQLFPL